MDNFKTSLAELCTTAVGKIILAAVALIVGIVIIKLLKKVLRKMNGFAKLDATVQAFMQSVIGVILYIVLIIIVVGILGVPMASVVAVLASAGLAVGLALQGALSNFAGGIMILIFKPFRVNDYIEASGSEGTVADINIFYTVIITNDNKRITVPNGTLMNASVTNMTSERARRVDIDFRIAIGGDCEKVKQLLISAAKSNEQVLDTPAPFAKLTGRDDTALTVTLRAWCRSDSYWDVKYDLTEKANAAFNALGIQPPEQKMNVRMEK